jgi:hypothetical protein
MALIGRAAEKLTYGPVKNHTSDAQKHMAEPGRAATINILETRSTCRQSRPSNIKRAMP